MKRELTEQEQKQREDLQKRLIGRKLPPDAFKDAGVPMLDETDEYGETKT